jgi:hypothetical protein
MKMFFKTQESMPQAALRHIEREGGTGKTRGEAGLPPVNIQGWKM